MYQVMISLYHSPKAIRDMAKNGTIGILVLPFTRPLISGMRHQSPAGRRLQGGLPFLL